MNEWVEPAWWHLIDRTKLPFSHMQHGCCRAEVAAKMHRGVKGGGCWYCSVVVDHWEKTGEALSRKDMLVRATRGDS